MLDAFHTAHAFTAQWEGGLSNHENDAGGLTHYGVSHAWLEQLEEANRLELQKIMQSDDGCNTSQHNLSPYDFNGDGQVSEEDVKACTREQAQELFKKHFWQALQCAKLPTALGMVLYDSAVNMGAPRAVRLLQESCNVVGEAHLDEFTPLKEDGVVGKKTLSMAKALHNHGLDFYTARLCVRQRIRFYTKLAQKNDSLAVFLQGWKNRCQALLEHLALAERDA